MRSSRDSSHHRTSSGIGDNSLTTGRLAPGIGRDASKTEQLGLRGYRDTPDNRDEFLPENEYRGETPGDHPADRRQPARVKNAKADGART